jgi:hypothetical protein
MVFGGNNNSACSAEKNGEIPMKFKSPQVLREIILNQFIFWDASVRAENLSGVILP